MSYTPENITELAENEVFVFGTNLAGVHSTGVARLAQEKFGAIRGEGEGHHGQSYAIPTKNLSLDTMAVSAIRPHVEEFLRYARLHPKLTFYVTQIGCGLAGYTPGDIAPLFWKDDLPSNVILPREFVRP